MCPEPAFNSWESHWQTLPVWRLLNVSWASLQFLRVHWPDPPVWRFLNVSWTGLQFLRVLLASSSSLKTLECVVNHRPSILESTSGQLLQCEGSWLFPEPAFNFGESNPEPAFYSWESNWPAPPVWRILNVSWVGLQFLRVQLASSIILGQPAFSCPDPPAVFRLLNVFWSRL